MTPLQDISEVIILTSTLIFGLLLRLVQYVRFKYPGSTDVFFFLSYMKNPHEFYQNIQPYPFLFPFLSATLKRVFRFSDRKLLLIGVIPDAITGLTAYLFMRSYFEMLTSLTALALFITTPALVHQSTFGPRSMGLLLYSLSLLALTLSFPLNVLSVLFVSLSALTHKLSLQTLFFVVLGYSILDATASLHFTLGFLLAFVISKMKYLRIFRFHLSYVKSMMENPKARYPNKEYLMLVNVPYAFLAPLAIVILLPDILSKWILDSLNISVVSFWYQPVGRLLTVWAIVPFLLVFFWRWGDSNRYITYSSLPLAVLFSATAESNHLLYYSLLALIGNIVIALYITRRNTLATGSFLQAADFLSKILDDGFCCTEEYYQAAKYFTHGKVVYVYSKDLSRVVKSSREQVNHFRYFIIPNRMLCDFKLRYDAKVLFSNEEWIVGKVEPNSS